MGAGDLKTHPSLGGVVGPSVTWDISSLQIWSEGATYHVSTTSPGPRACPGVPVASSMEPQCPGVAQLLATASPVSRLTCQQTVTSLL